MPDPGLLTAKVRTYMDALSPQARAMLGRSLRASDRLEGAAEIVLKAIDGFEAVGEPQVSAATGGEPWSVRLERAFFAPVAPFVEDEDIVALPVCRIPRRAVVRIWAWIRRDLAPAAWERALAADPLDAGADAAPIARKLRREVATALAETLRRVAADAKARQKLAGQFGGEAGFRAVIDVAHVLQHEAAFANLFGQIPGNLTVHDATESSRLFDAVRISLEQGLLGGDWIAASVLTRTTNPAVLAHLACRLAGSNDPRLVSGSRWAPLVEAVVGRIERHAARAAARGNDEAAREAFVADLRAYHDLTRMLELAMPVDNVAAWFRRLANARTVMSQTVAGRLETAPGLVRRALMLDDRGGWGGRFDAADVAEAEFAVRIALEAKAASDSLALHELVGRCRKQIEATLELVSSRLLEEMRSPAHRDRADLDRAVDAAIRLCAMVFGEEHAAVLRRSRDLAAEKTLRAAG